MRRLSGVLLAGAVLILPAFSQTAFAQAAPPQKTTYTGETVLAAYTVNPGKEADYEKVLATLKDSLMKSPRPEAKAAAGRMEGHQEFRGAARWQLAWGPRDHAGEGR
jgi:hypothetical protein